MPKRKSSTFPIRKNAGFYFEEILCFILGIVKINVANTEERRGYIDGTEYIVGTDIVDLHIEEVSVVFLCCNLCLDL